MRTEKLWKKQKTKMDIGFLYVHTEEEKRETKIVEQTFSLSAATIMEKRILSLSTYQRLAQAPFS